MKILIVDDDEIARMSLSNILCRPGIEAVQACDGEQAWELLEGGLNPVLCCSDIVMPRLDGLGLLQRTRQHPVLHELPFILISSAADRQTVEAAVAGGIAGYILKPFLGVQTRATVDRVLRETRAAQAEQWLITRRRLGIDAGQLEQMLRLLKSDALEAAEGAANTSDAANTEALPAKLQRMESGALVLGQWKAAHTLKSAMSPACTPLHQRFALEQVARYVDDQLAEFVTAAPVAAVPVAPAAVAAGATVATASASDAVSAP